MSQSPEGAPQCHKPKQRGFSISVDNTLYPIHKRGTEEIKKEIRVSKKQRKGPTPFEEVAAYKKALSDKEEGRDVVQLESLDGGLIIINPNTGIKSLVGETDFYDDRPLKIEEKKNILIPTLSPSAQRLFYALRSKEQKK